MAELQRFLRRTTSAALPAVLALGSLLSDAPKAFASPPPPPAAAQTQSATVSEQDAMNIFHFVASNKLDAITSYDKNYDSTAHLRAAFSQQAQTDQMRAAVLAFIAVGGVQLADKAAAEAVDRFSDPSDSRGWLIDVDSSNLLYKKYENKQMTYDGKQMSFVQEVAAAANGLLQSAYDGPHKTGNLTTFVTQYLMAGKSTNPWAPLFAQAGRSMGLSPANTTVAALTVPGQ